MFKCRRVFSPLIPCCLQSGVNLEITQALVRKLSSFPKTTNVEINRQISNKRQLTTNDYNLKKEESTFLVSGLLHQRHNNIQKADFKKLKASIEKIQWKKKSSFLAWWAFYSSELWAKMPRTSCQSMPGGKAVLGWHGVKKNGI